MTFDSWRWQAIHQLDRRLQSYRSLAEQPRPPIGWIATIRKTLGMSSRQLAERLGVTTSRAQQLEKAEVSGATTLQSLERAAEALGCRLVYSFVPEQSLADYALEHARRKAKGRMRYVNRHMALEDQALDADAQRQQVEDEAQDMLRSQPLHRFWDSGE